MEAGLLVVMICLLAFVSINPAVVTNRPGHQGTALSVVTPAATTETQRVRLVGGDRESEGRVDVYQGGQWGTVCDRPFYTFDSKAAGVVCRQLGYNSTPAHVVTGAYYGESDGPILLDKVECDGDETSILHCRHGGLGRPSDNCHHDHSHDVGVDCAPHVLPVRLVGGDRKTEGRVELYHGGQWGTVCDRPYYFRGSSYTFDTKAARVVCRQLGYNSDQTNVVPGAKYGVSDGPILLEDVSCNGDEISILQCRHNGLRRRVSGWCDHSDDVGVDCAPNALPVRLVGGDRETEGRVELYYDGRWGTVCDWRSTFDIQAARVVCLQLGYSSKQTVVVPGAKYGVSDGPVLLEDVRCHGDEISILQCQHDGRGRVWRSCNHSNDVGVDCAPNALPVRLVGGDRETEGRVELYHDGRWGTVCDRPFYTFDTQAARVVCRQVGYTSDQTNVVPGAKYGVSDGPILLEDVRCHGDEISILQCQLKAPWGIPGKCDHSKDVGVDCAPNALPVRLVGGDQETEGRVELYHGGQWGTVCDRSNTFDTKAARVVCRQLGYTSNLTSVVPRGYYGGGDGSVPLLLDRVMCRGDEANILFCAHTGVGRASGRCRHSHDVGVMCALQAPELTEVSVNGEESKTLHSALDQSVVLTCRARGWPAPSVRAYREDTGQQLEVRSADVHVKDVRQEHTVTSYTRCEDTAVYTCEASNGAGNATRSARLFINCAPSLSEGNSTPGFGTADKPFRVQRDQTADTVFHIVAYPAPYFKSTVFLGDTVPINTSLSDLVPGAVSIQHFVSCTPSDVILYEARCVVTTDRVEGGLYAVSLANGEGDLTVFLQVDPRSSNETTTAEPAGVDIVPIVVYTVAGGAVVLGLVLAVVGVLRLRRYLMMRRYSSPGRVTESGFYSQLVQDMLGISAAMELQQVDEDYHAIDDAHIVQEEPRLPVCRRRKRPSLKPRLHHVPLPPLPTENLQAVTSTVPDRRWSMPEDYLHPAVCLRLSQDMSDATSCQSEPFLYLDPPSKPADYLHPAVTASDRHRNSLPEDYLNPTLTLAEWVHVLPPDYLHPSAALSDRRRLSLPSDYLHPVAAPSEALPPVMSDYVPRVMSLARRSNSLPEDYLHPLPAFAKAQTSDRPLT